MALEYLGSSVFSDTSGKKGVPWAEVEIKDISTVWKSLALDRVDFMKINIEGAEFPLLERMIECNLLRKVDCFLIQFHEWHPGAYKRRRKIRKALSRITPSGLGLSLYLGEMGVEIAFSSTPERPLNSNPFLPDKMIAPL